MFAVYDEKTYIINLVNSDWVLSTGNPDKADDSFKQHKSMFYKPIDEADPRLRDLYAVDVDVTYNTNFAGVPNRWCVELYNIDFDKKRVCLDYDRGLLDGWETYGVGNPNICFKSVDFADLGQCFVKYTYYKKNGEQFDSDPLITHRFVNADQLISLKVK